MPQDAPEGEKAGKHPRRRKEVSRGALRGWIAMHPERHPLAGACGRLSRDGAELAP